MSVVIRGMKMPEDCPVCPLAHWNKLDRFTGCEIKKWYFDKADMETRGRPDFCPLVELPAEHGRLIDADALMKDGWVLNKQVMRMGGYAIHEMPLNYPTIPTIIEAEEE